MRRALKRSRKRTQTRAAVGNADSDSNSDSDDEDTVRVSVRGACVYFFTSVSVKSSLKLMHALEEASCFAVRHKLDQVTLMVNSDGGCCQSALSAYDYIRCQMTQTRVHAVVVGMCASAATLMLLACERREMFPNARMLVHEVRGGMTGDTLRVSKDEMTNLQSIDRSMKQIYKKHTTLDGPQIDCLLGGEREMTAEEAVKHGFVHAIRPVVGERLTPDKRDA